MIKLFDAHLHIIDYRFPLVRNNSYTPPEFTIKDYLHRTKELNICGGAIVSGSFQAFDQSYLLEALHHLGPNFVGVTQLPITVSDEEIIQLNNQGIRALRFNIKRGGSEHISQLKNFAHRVYEVAGWHVELLIDSTELAELTDILLELPAVSIDHLGLVGSGFSNILHLVEHGIKIKASGFGRVDFDVRKALQSIAKINPNALLFGTDLPSTRAQRPFLDTDIQLITDSFDNNVAEKILYRNALDFYASRKAG
ncbi:2-pyrone-4,6-dicarboxylate hydrolase [Legionella norrlandica]|uniref:2-pyrone-4,6-dicarboxylate hydrolase n=1 Tax=Legionella norrlandica TaxID=1498499 RepID=A0A0A2T962_9GAMM|nr:amidohydrolase family protein [Legionella norrlandica]KGP63938.1 2-pyrone-4,6-dicarboxylate hydrolase [Legionella norrlandica]